MLDVFPSNIWFIEMGVAAEVDMNVRTPFAIFHLSSLP